MPLRQLSAKNRIDVLMKLLDFILPKLKPEDEKKQNTMSSLERYKLIEEQTRAANIFLSREEELKK